MYALIMTMTLMAGSLDARNGSGEIASVDGFTSKEECLIAANAWLKQQREVHTSERIAVRFSAICAKK
ncbi:hypothetical protein [Xanthomonas phage XAJ2]|uniref:Uncharacterized protein n=1 Tax=Xanthomonas phage XAJ2 TaxID=1775249 RepID=A0A1I9L2H3_9CAUD|nr:hypothetical protein [Xanthomonas phage XAJ2]